MAQQHGKVGIVIQPFSERLTVSVLTRMRKAVVQRLVALGGEEQPSGAVAKIKPGSLEAIKAIFAEEYSHWEVLVTDLRPRPVVEDGKVCWNKIEDRHRLTWNGYLGKIKVFTVTSAYDSETKSYLYHLHTTLPGYSEREAVVKTEKLKESQEKAEEVIRVWLVKTGLAES